LEDCSHGRGGQSRLSEIGGVKVRSTIHVCGYGVDGAGIDLVDGGFDLACPYIRVHSRTGLSRSVISPVLAYICVLQTEKLESCSSFAFKTCINPLYLKKLHLKMINRAFLVDKVSTIRVASVTRCLQRQRHGKDSPQNLPRIFGPHLVDVSSSIRSITTLNFQNLQKSHPSLQRQSSQ